MASEVSRDRSLLCSSDGRIMLIQSSQNFVSSLTNILHVAQFALNKIDQIRTRAKNSCLGSIYSIYSHWKLYNLALMRCYTHVNHVVTLCNLFELKMKKNLLICKLKTWSNLKFLLAPSLAKCTSSGSRIFLPGALTPKVDVLTYYFVNFFAENWMKMKEFGPRGASLAPPWIRQCIQYSIWKLMFWFVPVWQQVEQHQDHYKW